MTKLVDTKIVVGQFGRVYGVHGWIKVNPFTEPATNILDYQPWYIFQNNRWQTIIIQQFKAHDHKITVKLPDYDSPEQARQLTNLEIWVERNQLPKLDEGEFYWVDLQGLTVQTVTGFTLGTVDYLFATGANDVLVVKGEKEHLIPYTHTIIRSIDINKQLIIVDWDPEF